MRFELKQLVGSHWAVANQNNLSAFRILTLLCAKMIDRIYSVGFSCFRDTTSIQLLIFAKHVERLVRVCFANKGRQVFAKIFTYGICRKKRLYFANSFEFDHFCADAKRDEIFCTELKEIRRKLAFACSIFIVIPRHKLNSAFPDGKRGRDKNAPYYISTAKTIKRPRPNPISSTYGISIAVPPRRSAYFMESFVCKRNSSLCDSVFSFRLPDDR